MEEQLVSYETAKLLSQLGFRWMVNHYYKNGKLEDSICHYDNYNDETLGDVISAPTLSLALKYLREKYLINIIIRYDTISYWIFVAQPLGAKANYLKNKIGGSWYKTYEEASEEALKHILIIIKEKKEN